MVVAGGGGELGSEPTDTAVKRLYEFKGDKRPKVIVVVDADSLVWTAENVSTAADNCFVVSLLVAEAEPA